MPINKGFIPKRKQSDRLPPGQYETAGFPVLSLGPTPTVKLRNWELEVFGLATPSKWAQEEFLKLPLTELVADIHCVTKWSKFDTKWKGVLIEDIMKITNVPDTATHLIAYSHDGYSSNIPLADAKGMQAMVALFYDDKPLEPEHGGPARLLVPHLYFWKSAKWLRALEFVDHDEPGFWETRGYHNYGDPWKEQRYSFD